MKTTLAITALLFSFSCLLLFQCKSKKPPRQSHDFTSSEEFKQLSRKGQVEKCGSCHKDIYYNEMIGPHANSYKNLQAHIDFIMSDAYDYSTYKKLIQEGKEACFGCHASKNLYESVFDFNETDYEMKKTFLGKRKKPRQRDEGQWVTGIDCITCHFDGEAVVTGKNFTPTKSDKECPGYCNPFASSFFSSNANCAPCHIGQYKDTEEFNTTNKASFTCASCHGEKSIEGKFTHYTYWAHNPSHKPLPDHLNLFTGLKGYYLPDKKTIKIVWQNNLTPHQASHCTELAAFIRVIADSTNIAMDTIRLNRKKEHVQNMAEKVNVTEFPGIEGFEFKGLGDSLINLIQLPTTLQNKSPLFLSITGIKKEQYWLSDSSHTKYFEEVVPIQ